MAHLSVHGCHSVHPGHCRNNGGHLFCRRPTEADVFFASDARHFSYREMVKLMDKPWQAELRRSSYNVTHEWHSVFSTFACSWKCQLEFSPSGSLSTWMVVAPEEMFEFPAIEIVPRANQKLENSQSIELFLESLDG